MELYRGGMRSESTRRPSAVNIRRHNDSQVANSSDVIYCETLLTIIMSTFKSSGTSCLLKSMKLMFRCDAVTSLACLRMLELKSQRNTSSTLDAMTSAT